MRSPSVRSLRQWLPSMLVWAAGMSVAGQLPAAESVDGALATIRQVDRFGQGNREAAAAARMLRSQPASTLPQLLAAFDGANPVAVNWLRSIVDSVADRTVRAGGELPRAALEKFIADVDRSPEARRLAYVWLKRVDPAAEERLIPNMLQDPGVEFRRDAVQRLIGLGQSSLKRDAKDEAKRIFQQALSGATQDDQVKTIVAALKELGDTVDLQQHFGFLTKWKVIGPFDNSNLGGFDVAYPPEAGPVPFDAVVPGKAGDVKWTDVTTDDSYGLVDLAKSVGAFKGAVLYSTTTFRSDAAATAEIRLGTPNAWKLWVNGELIFARDEYHRGMMLDQYRVPVKFKVGENVILLKSCQNEQTEEWAQKYAFQLRVCTKSGTAILPAASK